VYLRAFPPDEEVAMADKEMSFVTACKDFFGYKPGQTLGEFMNEVRMLTDADKDELKKEFLKVGYAVRN